MWALALLVVALAAHGMLVLWVKTALGPRAALVVAALGAMASLSLFADRSHFATTSFELAVVALGAALFAGFVVVVRLVRFAGRRRRAAPAPDDASLPTRRDALVSLGGACAWTASAATLGYGCVRGRHDVELTEHAFVIPGLPRVLSGYTLVQISDLHVGEHLTEADLERGLELVRRARPDLLVVTGDMVDFDASLAPMIASAIMKAAPRDGVYGILGNHDYYAGAGEVRAAFDRAGVSMLVNEGRILRARDGGGFALLGLDDRSAVRNGGRGPDLDRTLAASPGDLARILLAHQPPQFDEAAGRVALQLSGHTHGYQFAFAAGLGRIARRYVSGAYEKRGSHLWVNRGFGTTGPPSRVGERPEISKIVLVAG
ncbi:MAG: putative phosphoesterase [Labilithrix sp.]|nr:putative phosphoesterase [Labilithrix sp.]